METLELRQSVLDYIKNKADNKFLKLVNALAKSYTKTEENNRIDIEQYNKEMEASIAEIEQGKINTHKDVGNLIAQWANQ